MNNVSHLDGEGNAIMVNIGGKKETQRYARAQGKVMVSSSTYHILEKGKSKKGDIFAVARIAGIMAAKKTGELIPLCHPLHLHSISIGFNLDDSTNSCTITAEVTGIDRTGFEMEALTAVSVACLTLYDMLKSVEKEIEITNIMLVEKSGGKSGHFRRSAN